MYMYVCAYALTVFQSSNLTNGLAVTNLLSAVQSPAAMGEAVAVGWVCSHGTVCRVRTLTGMSLLWLFFIVG